VPTASAAIPVSKVVADLDAAESQASEIVASISDQQATWRPAARSWTIVQCLTHLARINRIYAAAMHETVANNQIFILGRENSSISPGWFGAWFIRSMEPPVRTRMKSPRKAVPPVETRDRREALAEFIESHGPVRGVIDASSHLDLNAVRFKNPFIGLIRFTIGTGLLVVNAHDRRHLWQAEQIKAAPGFPKQ